jgi:hypothetical protein
MTLNDTTACQAEVDDREKSGLEVENPHPGRFKRKQSAENQANPMGCKSDERGKFA